MQKPTPRIFQLIAIAALAGGQAWPQEQPIRTFDVASLVEETRTVVQRYFPEASVSTDPYNDVHVDHNTRIYLIHYPLKTGEWRDASETRGPRRGGIFLALGVRDGDYAGPAFLPMTTDRCYFSEYVTVFYSQSIDAHVHLTVRYSREYPAEMMQDLEELLMDFEVYVSEGNPR